jgi:putative FmdB family regulatory protein
MPLYSYVCPKCGTEQDAFNRVSDRRANAPECCGRKAEIRIAPVIGYVQRDCHYVCPVTDKPVTTNRQRKNIMAEHQLIDANDFSPKKAYQKAKKQHDRNEELAGLLKHKELPEKVLDKYRPALPTSV